MRQINLLPPEYKARRLARRNAMMLGAGVLGIVLLLLVVFFVEAGRVSSAHSTLQVQQQKNASLQAQAAQLSRFAQLETDLATKRGILSSLTQNEVRWSVILADIETVVPDDVWLTTLNGTVQSAAGAPTTGAGGQAAVTTYGTISVAGCTLLPPDGTHLASAAWLIRLGVPQEFVNAYLTLSAKGTPTCPVTFNSTVSLSDQSLRRNQRGGQRQP